MITIGMVSIGHEDYEWGWLSGPGSVGEVCVNITYRNDSQKTIKYIVFVTAPYNAVNDFVCEESHLRVTGPIPPGKQKQSGTWENCWFNGTIVGAKIQKIEITYMDNTTEVLTGSQIKYDKSMGSGEGCYVATCVYGSYDCPQVWTLRRYRDYTLAESWYGRAFIRTYYAISPTLVKWFGHTEWFKKMWQGKLDRMVAKLQSKGVESTPYKDREW